MPKRKGAMANIDLGPVAHSPWLGRRHTKKRDLAQREADLVFIAEKYLRGWTFTEISEELGRTRDYEVTPRMISGDLDVIYKRWIDSYLLDFTQAKAKELAHIDALECEYWKAWERSQSNIEILDSESVQDTTGPANGPATGSYQRKKFKKREKNSFGDKQFLEGVQWCIEMRCKIIGISMNTSTQNINVNWRKQAEQAGVDPDGVVDELVKQFVSAAQLGTGEDNESNG